MGKLKLSEDVTEYQIMDRFICALQYGDLSGLDDKEIEKLNLFIEYLPGNIGGVWRWGEYREFVTDDITGKMGHCFQALYTPYVEMEG